MHLIKFKEELSKIEFQTNRIWNREQIRGKFLHMFSLSVFHLRGRGEKKQIGLCLNLWRDFFLGFRLGLVSNNCLLLLASKAKQQTQSSVLNKQEWKRKEKDFICLEKKSYQEKNALPSINDLSRETEILIDISICLKQHFYFFALQQWVKKLNQNEIENILTDKTDFPRISKNISNHSGHSITS